MHKQKMHLQKQKNARIRLILLQFPCAESRRKYMIAYYFSTASPYSSTAVLIA